MGRKQSQEQYIKILEVKVTDQADELNHKTAEIVALQTAITELEADYDNLAEVLKNVRLSTAGEIATLEKELDRAKRVNATWARNHRQAIYGEFPMIPVATRHEVAQ